MQLAEAITCSGLSLERFGRLLNPHMSKSALCRLCKYGEWPTRRDKAATQDAIVAVLSRHNVHATIQWPGQGVRPGYGDARRREANAGEPIHRYRPELTLQEIDTMQLDRDVLAAFGLRTNPFVNDCESEADIYRTRGYDSAIRSIMDAIKERSFLAISAPSGAGKTTIWEGVETALAGREDIVICKPHLKDKEVMTPNHLAKALLYGLNGSTYSVPRDAEDCGRALSEALRLAAQQQRTPVLYIDDAHFSSTKVLRQLKTFYEEKAGRLRLMAIILVGLPELKNKLATFSEIGNRCRVLDIQPVPVADYLGHKLKRAGSSMDRLFDAGGRAALEERFRAERGTKLALGYPLAINTTVIRAMVTWVRSGAQMGERMTRELIDSLPGGASRLGESRKESK